jgi:Domain of Unknown Function (DUF1080)
MRNSRSPATLVVAALILAGSSSAVSQTPASPAGETLFDGKTLTNWQPSKFYGQGAVTIENGDIILAAGKDLTGITWSGPALPTTNYELTLQARRLEGRDFFAGITFPVGNSFCSLILGGWGGTMVGLSSINGIDASENSTSQSIDFEMQRWYDIRIRVTPEKIDSWLDGKHIIEQALKGNEISVRIEVEPSQPLGIASWRTKAGIRQIRLRRL